MDTSAWLKNAVKLALCLFVVPVLGWLTGMYLENTYQGEFQQMLTEQKLTSPLTYIQFCTKLEEDGVVNSEPDAAKLCSPANDVHNVFLASLAIAGVGAVLLLLIVSAKTLAGKDRRRMSAVFGPLIRVVLVLLAVSVLAQGALFVFSIYTLEAAAIHRVHWGVLAAVGLGAIAVCLQLLRSAFAFFKTEPNFARGAVLDRAIYANVYALVDGLAKKLGAQSPQNIVVGLEPNFYVTANDVRAAIPDATLTGSTLYMSLSLMRLLTKEELCAVIGHELGHFRGEDTTYSLRFAPTYARLSHTLSTMVSGRAGNVSDLARLPALQALTFCWMQFASAERAVGRERELLADKAGAEAASARALATALVKVAVYAQVWGDVLKQNIAELAEGRMYNDLSQLYGLACDSVHQEKGPFWQSQQAAVAENVQPHPVDTHPPLSVRLANLGLSIDDIAEHELGLPQVSALTLVADAEEQGKALTVLEDQWLVAIGAVVLPKQTAHA